MRRLFDPLLGPQFRPGMGLGGGATAGPPNPNAAKYIIDTDFAGDVDDATAFYVAMAAHKAGTINLIGVIVSATVVTAAPGVRALLNTFGLSYIPIYAYQGAVGTYNDRFTTELRDRFGVPGQTRTAFTDDLTGYKALLNASPNASVKIVGIGGLISLSRLLTDSPALVAAKVISLTQMAGQYPDSSLAGGPEYNITRDIASAQNVYANWPTPIYAHGAEIGANVRSGPPIYADSFMSPLKHSFNAYVNNGGTALLGTAGVSREVQSSWDTLAIHYAIYGAGSNFNIAGANGTITIDGSGNSLWTSTSGTRNYIGKAVSDAALGATLNAIIDPVEFAPTAATAFSVALTEGSGQYPADPTVSDMRFWRGGSERSQTSDPTWTDLGGGKWVLDFDGTNDFASMQTRIGFNTQNLVLGALVKLDVNTATRVIMAREDGTLGAGNYSRWNFRNNGGKLELIIRRDAGNTAIVLSSPSTSDLPTGTWHMVTASVFGTAAAIRKNGVDLATATQAAPIYSGASLDRVTLGCRFTTVPAGADFFDGQMAGVYFKAGAVAGDLATMETALRAIATAKSITIP